ncbi:uncharacterized protein B0T15DRAFT_421172 [Chaetomium strumarium]|uniref:DUF7730 domain-containing protein n=1 Tax=Chaetomium strumarium TaxID=1170767 RepID=A0AAJ0LZR2_9PEZI|nr:hypothetical protein B0T15DRAFT_421172 [Chaetomium strumarium]
MATTAFKRWLKHKISTDNPPKAEDGHATPEPPYRADWPILPATTANCMGPNYGLFGTLPLEVRQRILAQAFGSRTLHVDLTYDHPLVRKSQLSMGRRMRTFLSPRADEKGARASRRRHCGLGSDLVRDTSQPKRWQWFSCVCHRRVVEADPIWAGDPGPFPPRLRLEPWKDGCITAPSFERDPSEWGTLCRCEPIVVHSDRPMADDECFIGIMGWLLACRQAYIDGIDILYRTNAFHISSLPLLLDLPRLLPPHHLARIPALELIWDLFDHRKTINSKIMSAVYERAQAASGSPLESTNTAFHDLCELIPRTFPDARNVYVALLADVSPPVMESRRDMMSLFERAVLGPVEDMFRAMGPAPEEKEFSLALQSKAFHPLSARHWRERHHVDPSVYYARGDCCYYYPEALRRERVEEREGRWCWVRDGVLFDELRAWRPLDGDGLAGYWLRPGYHDYWHYMLQCRAFGGGSHAVDSDDWLYEWDTE